MYENLRSGYKCYLLRQFFFYIFFNKLYFYFIAQSTACHPSSLHGERVENFKIHVKNNCDASFKDLERMSIGFVVHNSNGDAEKI